MSYPPRPPMGVPPGLPPMFMQGMPPGMSIPPPMMGGQPPPTGMPHFFGAPMPPRPGIPPPMMRPPSQSHTIISKPQLMHNYDKAPDHPQPIPQVGPPVTVFVGNITEKWPDAMIRQLLATCGQVLNWKRVQGASGKLQGFGFCEYNGPDAGLRAVRLLHDLEVGDKKMCVKVDAKTNSVLEEFKADRKKVKLENSGEENGKNENGGSINVPGEKDSGENKEEDKTKGDEDYMDEDMKDADERSSTRISILFREFKNELDLYVPPGIEKMKPGMIPKGKSQESVTNKQQIQEKLHLLKLSSLENSVDDSGADLPEDLALEEGKREIITREISNFREHMKQEKQKEEERKRLGRERRERERKREKERERRQERGTEEITSPERSMSRERDMRRESPRRDFERDRERMFEFRDRDRNRNRRDEERDRRGRERERERERERDRIIRRRSRERRSRSRSVERILRSPLPPGPSKPRYREREEEEEAAEQKRLERKAREKETAYIERSREWEAREAQKIREYKKRDDRERRQEEERLREVKKIKQFLEDYDDEKHDPKYYKGKELQKRLSERARELEADNKDRQREREEIEDLKLRMLSGNMNITPTSSGTPSKLQLLDKYKKPLLDVTNSGTPPSATQLITGVKADPIKIPIASRLQALASSQSAKEKEKEARVSANNNHSKVSKDISQSQTSETITRTAPRVQTPTQPTSFSGIQISSFVPVSKTPPNQSTSTPNSLVSPLPIADATPSPTSKPSSGFQMTIGNSGVSNSNSVTKKDDDDSRHSFSPAPSPGMPTPQDIDDSSIQGFSPAELPKKKKMDVKDVFNQDEDDDGMGLARKRKLVPLDYGDEASKKAKKDEKSQEEKKKNIKALIEKIPTDKDDLFNYLVDWEKVDTHLMEKRIRPWINKKIVEYIGEPEPTLVDFICSKVMGRSAPQSILDDVQMVLDEEAEVFVVKMWRLLVYEIEARNLGVGAAGISKGDT